MNQFLELFKSAEHLSNTGFAVRAIVSLVLIYLMSKFLMKRAAGQFTAFDFVFLWMLGALAVAPLLDGKYCSPLRSSQRLPYIFGTFSFHG